MTTRYDTAHNAIIREQARVVERALTMVMDDEERRLRDSVLIALDVMRHRLGERGVSIAPAEVLAVYEEITGACIRGLRLPTMLDNAKKRQESRRQTDPQSRLSAATAAIEEVAAPRKQTPHQTKEN